MILDRHDDAVRLCLVDERPQLRDKAALVLVPAIGPRAPPAAADAHHARTHAARNAEMLHEILRDIRRRLARLQAARMAPRPDALEAARIEAFAQLVDRRVVVGQEA